jgi:ATP phosphoribosyltransferase
LEERDSDDVLQVGDLDLAVCRVVLAGRTSERPDGPFLVASKYRRLTERYLERRHWQADIVPLSGSLELAPLIGLAPYIVDIVETGETLRQHHLVEIETVMTSNARLIANPAHWRAKPEVPAVRDRLMNHLA